MKKLYFLMLLLSISLISNGQKYSQKEFSVGFPDQQANLAVDILLGNRINGWIELNIVSSYSHQNSVGIIRKLYNIGANDLNSVWSPNQSRVVEASGPILNNIYVGEIIWDTNINQYKITVYHTSTRKNNYSFHITHHSISPANISGLSQVYTNVLEGQNKHYVFYNQNVGIGISNPKNKLDVNGTVHAKEVKVDMNGWADYVFKKEYDLPTLQEVETHIQEKGHLPNIPSEKEVIENGISLGEMQKLLLQKIEELTLYLIEQQEKNKKLEKRISKIENKN